MRVVEGESDKVNFQTAEQCSYVYMLYSNQIENCRTLNWLSRQRAEADTSEIFSKCMELKQKTRCTCEEMRTVLNSRIINEGGGKWTGGGQR